MPKKPKRTPQLEPPPIDKQLRYLEKGDRFEKLEERVRDLESTVNKATGVLSVMKWLLPPLITAGAILGAYFFGQASNSA